MYKVELCSVSRPVPSKRTHAGSRSLATVAYPTTEETLNYLEISNRPFCADFHTFYSVVTHGNGTATWEL